MTDSEERKDLIYPTSDAMDLKNSAQFDNVSNNSPTHTGAGILPSKTAPIQIELDNGFSSEDDSDEEEMVTMSQSCGQAELKQIKEASSKQGKDLLSGKVIELHGDQDLIVDERIQSTYALYTKPVSKSLPRKYLSGLNQRESRSNHSFPTHTTALKPSVLGHYRSPSPDIGGRIKSNPFFVQDRISRSNLNSSDRTRLDSAPAKVNMKIGHGESSNERFGISQSAVTLSTENTIHLSPSRSFSGGLRKPVDPGAAVDIQSRIKLWAEKEREAKESKEQLERVRSPNSQKGSPIKEAVASKSQSSPQLKKLVKVLKSIESTEDTADLTDVKQQKTKKEKKQELSSSSTSLGSPTRPKKGARSRSSSKGSKDSSSEHTPELSPKKNRWKLRSPLFSRKKTASRESLDSEQSDDNMLMGSQEQLATSKGAESPPSNKISSRSSNKRKAIKKRLSSTFGMTRSNSDSKALDDQLAMPSKKPVPPHEQRPRSNSLGTKLRLNVNRHRRALSQPDIKSLVAAPSSKGPASTSELSKRQSAIPNGTTAREDESSDALSVAIRKDKGRRGKDAKDRTISRDIRDIINSLGTGSLEREDSDLLMSQVREDECVQIEVDLTEQATLDIIVQPPTNSDTPSSKPPMLFSDEEETFIPRGGSIQECGPIMSSLDIGKTRRAAIKRRLSDSTKALHSTKIVGPNKSPPLPRVGSLSPTDESSDAVIATPLMYADAVWDRVALEEDELSFSVGDAIEILDMTDDVWWYGSVDSANGWFPASFVRLRIGQDSDGDNDSVISADPSSTPPPSHNTPPPPQPITEPPRPHTNEKSSEDQVSELPQERRRSSRHPSGTVHRRMTIRRKDSAPSLPHKLTSTEVRAKVIEEILSTERDYVKHLEDIIEGYVKQCRKYNKLFDEDKVETIFSNVEAIYTFQKDFLRELEASINQDKMEDTQIGEVFVNNRHEFDIYCQYCNNHPHAVNEMNQLQENEQYTFFFESCRLLRNLQDISLEGFLLTPVQKICKYPLQLSELLKYTSEEHPDYPHVVAARDAMREVAMHINEMKRRMENIGKIGRWQTTIEGWKGEDILQTSSQMLRCGELHKISKGRSQERHFFLFDRQLVYCKKDTIGGKLTYKGRVNLDQCQITDMEDGTAMHSGSVVKNAWRMNNKAKDNKWYIIFARSPEEKRDWMSAFEKERELLKDDEEKRFQVSLKMKKSAVALCASAEQLRRGRRKSSSVPSKNRVPLLESVDSAKHKLVTQKLSTSASSPQAKSKTIGRKKKGSNS